MNTPYLEDVRGGCPSIWGVLYEREMVCKIPFPIGLNYGEDAAFMCLYSLNIVSICISQNEMYYYRLVVESISNMAAKNTIYKCNSQIMIVNYLVSMCDAPIVSQKRKIAYGIRKCLNRFYAEAISGRLKIKDILIQLSQISTSKYYPSTIVSKYFGLFEYAFYMIALSIKR